MDARRELINIRKHYREYQRKVGESVVWFEFSPFASAASAGSTYDDVYDEGNVGTGGRKYKDGIVIPVLMITETEDTKRAIPEGRQPVEVVNAVFSIEEMRTAGLENPFEYQKRLNDIFLYDGRYLAVQSYRVRGRARDDLMVVVEGMELYIDQEFPMDVGPAPLATQDLPWPSTIANT
jgi:hypothetical protein